MELQPSHCSCSHPFSVEHALNCKTGGFPGVRHNEVRDKHITVSLLSEVCHGVTTEPISVYRRHEQEKKRQYQQRVHEVEHATFTPLVMSSTGSMGRAASTFFKEACIYDK